MWTDSGPHNIPKKGHTGTKKRPLDVHCKMCWYCNYPVTIFDFVIKRIKETKEHNFIDEVIEFKASSWAVTAG